MSRLARAVRLLTDRLSYYERDGELPDNATFTVNVRDARELRDAAEEESRPDWGHVFLIVCICIGLCIVVVDTIIRGGLSW